MNNKFIASAAFVIGAASGALGAWYILKDKYERIAQEEIDSVKEYYKNKKHECTIKCEPDIPEENNEPEVEEVEIENEAVDTTDYDDYKIDGPYIISPEEFEELPCYSKIPLTVYSDLILADETNELIEDADRIIGADAFEAIKNNHEGEILVRNDRLMCDYEITKDDRTYLEAIDEPKESGDDE